MHDARNAHISQKQQDRRNIYVILKTVCPSPAFLYAM